LTIVSPEPPFRLLGPLAVTGSNGAVRIPPGRQEVILAALLLAANRVVSTDSLVDLIWDERPPDTARVQVQICISRLRKSFVEAGLDEAIRSRPPGYILEASDTSLDLMLFSRHVGRARVLVKEGRIEEAAEVLRAAAGMWRGKCLNGVPSEALRAKALRIDEDRLGAIETYLDLELALGRHHQLASEIGRLVDEHPLRERMRCQYMLALYRSGRQAEALEAYRHGRDLLIRELAVEPGNELRLLETAILSGDPALSIGSEPVAPQVSAMQQLPYSIEKPRQLPAGTADFVGRQELIDSVVAILTTADEHLPTGVVVIAGKPGIGKSTMATHVAHRLAAAHFTDGQLYCDLRGTCLEPVSSTDVLGRFLRALGVPGPLIPDSVDERAEMYRTILATRQLLVLLDDAASEGQIGPLLPGGGNCAVIVTSRSRLTGLPGGHWIELGILDVEQAIDLLGRVIGSSRVEREPDAAVALVRAVGGLPLALRIVAARLAARPHWTLASIVHRLANERHRLDELAYGDLTVRASLSLTYDGLSPADKRLLRLLSLAQGSTLPGWIAGALLDDHRPRPSDLMEPLYDVQMLDVLSVEHTGEFSYRFHEIIRLFVRDQLEATDTAAVQQAATERMIGGWLALAEQAHAKIYGGDYTLVRGNGLRWKPAAACAENLLVDPLQWMDDEHVNLALAVDQAAQVHLDEQCWQLATTLVTLFEVRGYLDLWEGTHQRALIAVRQAGNKLGEAALFASLGTLHLSRLQPAEARGFLGTALTLFDELGNSHGQALTWRDLALLDRHIGEYDRALAGYERSLRHFDLTGDIVGRATVLTQSAFILIRRGDIAEARARLDEALAIFDSVGYEGGKARALRRVGQLLLEQGEPEAAERALIQVLTMVRAAGDILGEGHLLMNLGEVNANMGRLRQAEALFQQAKVIRDQIMDLGGAAAVRLTLARISIELGERTKARELLDAAIPAFRDCGMGRELQEAEQLRREIGMGSGPPA
jgi:DNA-binding SARP family transcriptional activator/Tfp pilus assembly protein PilF